MIMSWVTSLYICNDYELGNFFIHMIVMISCVTSLYIRNDYELRNFFIHNYVLFL